MAKRSFSASVALPRSSDAKAKHATWHPTASGQITMADHHHATIPAWTWIAPAAASVLLALKFTHVINPDAAFVLILSGLLLGAAVFAAVHHAEVLALKLGEPFGSILLAVAVTVIEVALIVSILATGAPGSDAVARDTVFSAVMIVLNGIVGLCLVLGARRHYEQSFQLRAASAALAVLGTLAVLALVLPNYTLTTPGPHYSPFQLIFVGVVSLVLYGMFIFVQTIRHRDYFLELPDEEAESEDVPVDKPSDQIALFSLGLLVLSLVAVVLLAKILSPPLDTAVAAAGLPQAFVGVVIAAIVLLPEGIAAAQAAMLNRLQNSMNLALGSAIASIGLTIPVVAVVSLMWDMKLVLGLSPGNTVLLLLTLFVSTLTLGTGKTTVLQGAIHLVIFAVFIVMSAVP
jgi:Ca2+:H+ antiporter